MQVSGLGSGFRRALFIASVAMMLAACGRPEGTGSAGEEGATRAASPEASAYRSTYRAYPGEPTLLSGATVLTGTGERIDDGAVYFADGRIVAVGRAGELDVPEGTAVIELDGQWVTPGIIDNHSHLGVYPSPGLDAVSDGNEMVEPNTAYAWAEHAVWTQDAGFTRALAGGITTLQILPGSANLFGGRSVVLKNVPARTVGDMKFPGARHGLKMACGENPQGEGGYPATRMGIFAGYRNAWIAAEEYKRSLDEAGDDAASDGPGRDLTLETLVGVLNDEINIHFHCYRADDMAHLLELSEEFGFKIAAFHHAIEGYKIADLLAERGVCASVWADWWGFKLEAFDTVPENAALIDAQPKGCAIIHSDSGIGIQRLNQEAAKAMTAGNRRGMNIAPERAIQWITRNPAKSLGIDDRTGTLEPDKMADIVVWDRDPFSVYAKAEQVFIDGALLFDRGDPDLSPRVDFELGLRGNTYTGGAGQ